MKEEALSYSHYFETLSGLKNPRNEHIIRDPKTVEELWKAGASLDDLLKLFRLASDQRYEKFFAGSVVTFTTHGGYTTEDLLRVASLKDTDGNDILHSSNDFWDFMKIRGKIEDAEAIAELKDSEGKTVYRYEPDSMGDFDGFGTISNALEVGATADRIQELIDIRNDEGISVFRTPRDINRFLEHGGNLVCAKALLALRDHNGKQIFEEFSIGLFQEVRGTTEYATQLTTLKDTEGQTVFSDGKDVYHYLVKEKRWRNGKWHFIYRSIEEAEQFVALKDAQGKTVIRDGKDIVGILKAGGTLEKIRAYITITGSDGQTHFRGDEIAILQKHEVPAEYARKLAKRGLNAVTIIYYYHIEFNENQTNFIGSGKPKALILYPASDPVFLVEHAYRDEATFKLLNKFMTAYDVKIRVISSVTEMLGELDKAPDVNLLWLGGHGTGTSICFGENNPKYGITIEDDQALLTPNDTEIGEHIKKLSKLRVILLDSCYAGKGAKNEVNMVNFMASQAPGRLVLGPTGIANAHLIKINRLYPLEMQFQSSGTYKDCTHRRKLRPPV